jgi:hypothetical protein
VIPTDSTALSAVRRYRCEEHDEQEVLSSLTSTRSDEGNANIQLMAIYWHFRWLHTPYLGDHGKYVYYLPSHYVPVPGHNNCKTTVM